MKKFNKKLILNSSIFTGINNIYYCGNISGKSGKSKENGKKTKYSGKDDEIKNQKIEDNNIPTQDQQEEYPKKDDQNQQQNPPTQNPPTQNPPQTDNPQQLYIYFCELWEFCKKNESYYNDPIKTMDLDSIKNCVDKSKKDIDYLKYEINNMEKIKTNIEGNIAKEKDEKEKKDKEDKEKKEKEDKEKLESIYDKIEPVDIDEKHDLSDINITFRNPDNFIFKSCKASYKFGTDNKVKEKDFKILEDLIKNFLAKKNLKGNFTIDYIVPEHLGVNPILKVKILNNESGQTFCAFIKNEQTSNNKKSMSSMFKLFQIVDLLPFEYYIDVKNDLIITEDLNEKGFIFLDNKYNPTTERNKEMWKNCTNMNEFRFWCYILNSDDIDPMYKYDNCCLKDNKFCVLDLRCIAIDRNFISISPEDHINKYYNDYKNFLRTKFREINTDTMDETKEQYKIWDESIKNFNDFTDEEKESINEKIIKLISYIVGIFKDKKIQSVENKESKDYLTQVANNIMNFLQFYICKYKKKYTRFEYNGETLKEIYNHSIHNYKGWSLAKANYIFKKLIDTNNVGFEYFLTSMTLFILFDIYNNKPTGLFYGDITTNVYIKRP